MTHFAWTGHGHKRSSSRLSGIHADDMPHDDISARRKLAIILCSSAALWSLIGAVLVQVAH